MKGGNKTSEQPLTHMSILLVETISRQGYTLNFCHDSHWPKSVSRHTLILSYIVFGHQSDANRYKIPQHTRIYANSVWWDEPAYKISAIPPICAHMNIILRYHNGAAVNIYNNKQNQTSSHCAFLSYPSAECFFLSDAILTHSHNAPKNGRRLIRSRSRPQHNFRVRPYEILYWNQCSTAHANNICCSSRPILSH